MVRNGHRQDLSPGDWLQSQCSQPTQNFQDVFCGGGGGSGEGMGGEMQSNIYGQVRFILKKMHALLGMEIMCLFLKEGKSCKFSQMEKFVEETQLL